MANSNPPEVNVISVSLLLLVVSGVDWLGGIVVDVEMAVSVLVVVVVVVVVVVIIVVVLEISSVVNTKISWAQLPAISRT